MEVSINFWAILVCAVVSMVLGSVWYGPIFGKKWSEIIGATDMDLERKKEMQKGAQKLYVIAFLLSLLQAYVLAHFLQIIPTTPYEFAFWLWIGVVIPVVAGGAMWNNDSAKVSWWRFLIQAGYYLVLIMLFTFILTADFFHKNTLPVGEQVACTMDATQCPNGTWVGRTGPNCEFVC